MVEKLFPDPFLKYQNLTYRWMNSLKFVFIVYQIEGYRHMLKLSCRPVTFTSFKAFLQNKKRSGASLPAPFFA